MQGNVSHTKSNVQSVYTISACTYKKGIPKYPKLIKQDNTCQY